MKEITGQARNFPSPLMTYDDLAAHYRMTKKTLYNLKYLGQLPRPVQKGRRVLGWRPEDVAQWDKEHTH